MFKAWGQFIRERFEPVSHLLLIGCFVGADLRIIQSLIFSQDPEIWRVILIFVVSLLFFFHLRLFDELKDYRTDLEVNKDRPLPRGLIGLKEFKIVLISVISLELVLVSILGVSSLASFLIPLGYSLLMYREFFIGPWLRPKMEAYAISHTFVSGLLVLFFASSLSELSVAHLPRPILWVVLFNWMIFNTFEFARKSFSPEEERPSVESYSSRWKALGAAIWTIFFTFLAMSFLMQLNSLLGWKYLNEGSLAISSLVWIAALIYGIRANNFTAKNFRLVSSFYLVAINLLIIVRSFG